MDFYNVLRPLETLLHYTSHSLIHTHTGNEGTKELGAKDRTTDLLIRWQPAEPHGLLVFINNQCF